MSDQWRDPRDYADALVAEQRRNHLLEKQLYNLVEHIARERALETPVLVFERRGDLVLPSRPIRGPWQWKLRFSDWLEDVIIPRLRRKR